MYFFRILRRSASSSFSLLSVLRDYFVKNFVFRESWIDSEVAGIKVTFSSILTKPEATSWPPKGSDKELLKQHFS